MPPSTPLLFQRWCGLQDALSQLYMGTVNQVFVWWAYFKIAQLLQSEPISDQKLSMCLSLLHFMTAFNNPLQLNKYLYITEGNGMYIWAHQLSQIGGMG